VLVDALRSNDPHVYEKTFVGFLITGNRLTILGKKRSQEHLQKVKFWSLNLIQGMQKLTRNPDQTQNLEKIHAGVAGKPVVMRARLQIVKRD
jgi:hypothetical protein